MTTLFREEEGENLEGNRICSTCTLGGAAFMSSDARTPSGMRWRAFKLSNGYYHLTTGLVRDNGQVLEGNRLCSTCTLKGAAFMSSDQGASGTFWKATPVAGHPGYYQLTAAFREAEGEVLEGNRLCSTCTLGGAAFMSGDKRATGTFWKFVEL